jgi:hypothetical protein
MKKNMEYKRKGEKLNKKLEKLELKRNDIIYITEIGKREFPTLFKQKQKGIVKGEELNMVEVKMIKDEE